jgi:uncharacterized protein (DUF1800 family)
MIVTGKARRFLWIMMGLLLLANGQAHAQAWSREDAAHLLRRAGFGGTGEQIDRLHAMGKMAAVEHLLGVRPGSVFPATQPALFQSSPVPEDRDARQRYRREETQRYRQWWIERMIRTDRPLDEKMTLFWHGLLTSGIQEAREPAFIIEQNQLFREQATGNYKTLIKAILRDPAMLRYLNADQNVRGKPNENLARELLELFTMGEGNGYTEKDIAEVARALTGLAVTDRGFTFRPTRHDPGSKTIFGRTGNFKPDDVPDLIFARPQPAQYLARRLWEFYAYPDPSPADYAAVTQALQRNNWELKPALRAMFLSPQFYTERAKFALIKSPAELVVGTVRLLEVNPTPALLQSCTRAMDSMGQTLFQPPNVRGWPGGEQWVTSATLFTRYNTASQLVSGVGLSGGVRVEAMAGANAKAEQVVDAAVARFLQRPLNDQKRAALLEVMANQPAKASRRDRDNRVRQMVSLVLSTPEYQVN